MPTLPFLAQQLASHPKWQSLSWETRGMALQLMAMGDDELLGTLAPEDDFWRNCLHIPHKATVDKALKQSLSARGSKQLGEIDIAWKEVWKPELLRWFVLIDDDFLKTKPELLSAKGRYWYPLVDVLAEQQAERFEKTRSKRARKSVDQDQSPKTTAKRRTSGKKNASMPPVPEWDYPVIRLTPKNVSKCWAIPADKETRLQIWRGAVDLLSHGKGSEEASARQFVGLLIKDYGEKEVAKAVAELMVRPIKPADPKSFLRKQLKNATEGSEKVQKARMQRAKIPL